MDGLTMYILFDALHVLYALRMTYYIFVGCGAYLGGIEPCVIEPSIIRVQLVSVSFRGEYHLALTLSPWSNRTTQMDRRMTRSAASKQAEDSAGQRSTVKKAKDKKNVVKSAATSSAAAKKKSQKAQEKEREKEERTDSTCPCLLRHTLINSAVRVRDTQEKFKDDGGR